jgi:hypothetical protein
MYQSVFMVEQETQLRRQKAQQRQAEQRRLALEAATATSHKRRWPTLGTLYQLTFCAFRSIWRSASPSGSH